MATKGYPKSRFEVVNQTHIQSIETTTVSNPTALYLQPYTSNKGTEDWELLTGFDGFTKTKGGMSFYRHGQAQLTVAQALKSGAYVLGKRLVSEDATLANTTVMARLVKVDDVTYVYYYTKSAVNCGTFEGACEAGYGSFEPDAEDVTDIPLFTVTPMGRGESLLFFRINPINVYSKKQNNSGYMKYSFEVIEDNELLENIVITMNPDIIIDGASQAINPKIRNNSKQIRVKLYEDGVYKLVELLANTAVTESGAPITPNNLINMDFINGYDRSGTAAIGGVVTIVQNGNSENSEWVANKPSDIEVLYDLSNPVGIPLVNGSYGTMGNVPMNNPEEMEKMLLAAFGKDKDSDLFDSIIYDLDAYKIDCIFDCNWPVSVKNAIIDLIDFRGDMTYFADLGTKANTLSLIKESVEDITNSNYSALYHNYFKIIDPFTKKEITVTMPYLLIDKLTKHISKGVGRPFAGIANNIYFPDIIEGTVNYFPVEIPGMNQKQELVDLNINYLSMYDGVPVMETMYVNDTEYSQLSYLHNIMGVQEIIKVIRTRCPRTRYTFLDGDDLETYIADVQTIIKEYATNFKSISCEYMADEAYEQNNIFYAVLKVQFKNFIQEEYFKIIAIS
jgi:hypothetical protein